MTVSYFHFASVLIKQKILEKMLILRIYIYRSTSLSEKMKKVNKQCLIDTPRTIRVSEKTWQVIVRTRRP